MPDQQFRLGPVEAAEFGVPTVLTSEIGAELYARLAEAGWVATETGEPSRVIGALDALQARRRPAARRSVPLDEALDELLAEAN